jgi:hypothetical protein
MVSNTLDYWVFGRFPSSGILKNTTFRKLDLFPSSGEKVVTQQSMCLSPPHLKTETDPVSEKLCSSEYRTMDRVQNPVIPSILKLY